MRTTFLLLALANLAAAALTATLPCLFCGCVLMAASQGPSYEDLDDADLAD